MLIGLILTYIAFGYVTLVYYLINDSNIYMATLVFWPYFWTRGLWRSWQLASKT